LITNAEKTSFPERVSEYLYLHSTKAQTTYLLIEILSLDLACLSDKIDIDSHSTRFWILHAFPLSTYDECHTENNTLISEKETTPPNLKMLLGMKNVFSVTKNAESWALIVIQNEYKIAEVNHSRNIGSLLCKSICTHHVLQYISPISKVIMITDSEFKPTFSIFQKYQYQLIAAIYFSSPKNSSKKNPKLQVKSG
jgi:hypothetical protein